MRYRKRPVILEAMQFTDNKSAEDILRWAGSPPIFTTLTPHGGGICDELTIHTLEGAMTASLGDWVIRGVSGEFYPCKPDIFDLTYEAT